MGLWCCSLYGKGQCESLGLRDEWQSTDSRAFFVLMEAKTITVNCFAGEAQNVENKSKKSINNKAYEDYQDCRSTAHVACFCG